MIENYEKELLKEVEDFIEKRKKEENENRWREAKLYYCNDILYSRDLFVIDVLNQQRSKFDPEDYKRYRKEVLACFADPSCSPLVGIRENWQGELELYSYTGEVGMDAAEMFVHSKKNEFMFYMLAMEILDKYKDLWKATRLTKPNLNIENILAEYNAFVIIEDKFFDYEIIMSVLGKIKDTRKFIKTESLPKWINKYTDNSKLYITWVSDLPMKVEVLLDTIEEDIIETQKDNLHVKQVILPMNSNSMSYYEWLKTLQKHEVRFSTLIYKTFEMLNTIKRI